MPQIQLPIFPAGTCHITSSLYFENKNGKVTYFNGLLPVFQHDEKDHNSFRMITSQFSECGCTKQSQIIKAFGVSSISVKRAAKKYREEGPAGFYQKPKRRGAVVLTPAVVLEAQKLLDNGMLANAVAKELGIKSDTFKKAIKAGRLHESFKKKSSVKCLPQKVIVAYKTAKP